MAAVGATRRPPPRPDRAAAVGPRLLIRQSRSPAYFAASPHIWRPFHYPPPADAVGSSYSSAPVLLFTLWQEHTHTHTHSDTRATAKRPTKTVIYVNINMATSVKVSLVLLQIVTNTT